MITFTPPSASVTRRVAVGLSAGAAGADGVPELAQSAHEALMRAPWVESPDAPSMPVHDNGQTSNRSVPSGDAFKCGYGYDATNRTERAAAGAVCYSFQLPSATVAATAPATVTGLTVRVIGDRYLDAGARVFVMLTGSAQPPTLAEMMGAEAASGVVCATSGQTKPDGVTPLAPNNRTGVRADAEITPATPLAAPEGATAAYLHVCLALADYTTTRGAWIEGGAMLAPDTLRITFDREVEDGAAATAARPLLPMPETWGEDGTPAGRLERSLVARLLADPRGIAPTAEDTVARLSEVALLVREGLAFGLGLSVAWERYGSVAPSHDAGLGALLARSGQTMELRAGLCVCYMPLRGALSGRSIPFLFPIPEAGSLSASPGLFRLLAVALDGVDKLPDASVPGLFDGTSPRVLGTCDFDTATARGGILRLIRDAPAGSVALGLLCLPLRAHSAPGAAAWGLLPETLSIQ